MHKSASGAAGTFGRQGICGEVEIIIIIIIIIIIMMIIINLTQIG